MNTPEMFRDGGFAGKVAAYTEESLALGMRLLDALPHGSGIDYDWDITETDGGTYDCANAYLATNDVGMYCHIWDFSVSVSVSADGIYTMGDLTMSEDPETCEECGLGLKEYLNEDIYQMIDMANERFGYEFVLQDQSEETDEAVS